MNVLKKYSSSLCVIIILTILPLYVENAYFNITYAKFHALLFALILIVPLTIITLMRTNISVTAGILKKIEFLDISLILFAVSCTVSSVFSGHFFQSFFGTSGWCVGAFTYIVLTLIYLYIINNHIYSRKIWLYVYTVNIFVFIVGLLQFAGYDLFGFRENMVPKQLYQYISTFGNTNWYAGYLCLLIPMSLVFYLTATTKNTKIINLIFLFFACANMLICISDGVYLGIGFSLFFLIPFVFKSIVFVRRLLFLVIIVLFEAIVIRLFPCYSGLLEKAAGISSLTFNLKLTIPLLLVCVTVLIFLSKANEEWNIRLRMLGWVIFILFSLFVVAFIVYTIFTFHDRWGSSRGLIWRISFENFSNFSIKEKIIGVGPELLKERYIEVQRIFENMAVKTSHSEPIQILLTTGIVGVTSWVLICVSIIRSYFKDLISNEKNTDIFAYFLPLTAYFAQSLVNSATTTNLCLLFILLAFYRINKQKLIEKIN